MKPPAKFLEWIANTYKDNNAKMLIHAASASWGLVTLANVVGISTSKKIEDKQKKYLVPSELADGVVNIGLFALITTGLVWAADKLANNKNLIEFKTVAENSKGKIYKNIAKSSDVHKNAVGGLRVIASLVGAVIASNIITPFIRREFASWRQKSAIKENKEFVSVSPAIAPLAPSLPFKNAKEQHLQMSSFSAFTKNSGMKI